MTPDEHTAHPQTLGGREYGGTNAGGGRAPRQPLVFAGGASLVRKKDGFVHFFVDYQKMNGVTLKHVYPIPGSKITWMR